MPIQNILPNNVNRHWMNCDQIELEIAKLVYIKAKLKPKALNLVNGLKGPQGFVFDLKLL